MVEPQIISFSATGTLQTLELGSNNESFDCEGLTIRQKAEFSQVLLQQKAIAKQLKVKNFDRAIEVGLKLKPKFTLRQSETVGDVSGFSSTNEDTGVKELLAASKSKSCYLDKVSLVVTVYNRARYLAETIESIQAQTYTNFELIVWDDGSSDDSLAIAKKYARYDTRIEVFSADNVGQAKATVEAIARSKGKYLGLVDSDDLLHSEALAQTVAVLESNSRIGMVYTDSSVIDAYGRNKGVNKRSSTPYSPQRLLIDFMTFHFRLIRRSVYDAVGGIDPNFVMAHDYNMCLRLSEVTQIEHLTQPLYFYRWHQDNLSSTRQLKQTQYSALAVNHALRRRGLDEKVSLEIKLNPHYQLQRRSKVANKVFGIGLSKTGTTSLNTALNLLGIPSIHLPRSLEQIEVFDGATDISVAVAYQELDRLYPGSKFILTIRHLRSWLRSNKLHRQRLERRFDGRIPDWLKEISVRCYGQWDYEPTVWSNVYRLHLHSVLEYFQHRESQLLVLNICGGQGWQELCSFLYCQIPNIAFPARNQTPCREAQFTHQSQNLGNCNLLTSDPAEETSAKERASVDHKQ